MQSKLICGNSSHSIIQYIKIQSKTKNLKCSQSRRPRGKGCCLTNRTLPQAHATPFEQPRSKAQQRRYVMYGELLQAPGKDSIPPEVLKHGKQTILQPLRELLCLCWEHANIVTLYKNKGDRSNCNNYCGISLLSIVGKVFARVTLTRLQSLASQVYPESQCGFRAGRSTVDMIFSLLQLQDKCREQQQPLFLAFVDLTKAFDLMSRSGLFKILQKIGCPPKLLAIITSFHQDVQSTVCFDGVTSNAFPVSSGVRQGCVL